MSVCVRALLPLHHRREDDKELTIRVAIGQNGKDTPAPGRPTPAVGGLWESHDIAVIRPQTGKAKDVLSRPLSALWRLITVDNRRGKAT